VSATLVATLPGATYTGVPVLCQVGREQAIVLLSRPATGGPVCVAHVLAGDGRHLLPPLDLRDYPCRDAQGRPFLLGDCFGASAFVSQADPAQGGGTIKLAVNVKTDEQNGRGLLIVSTGLTPDVTR
jgi:hypothetical protein